MTPATNPLLFAADAAEPDFLVQLRTRVIPATRLLDVIAIDTGTLITTYLRLGDPAAGAIYYQMAGNGWVAVNQKAADLVKTMFDKVEAALAASTMVHAPSPSKGH